MKKVVQLFCAVLLFSTAAEAQLDSLPWKLTIWGQHRSNTLDHELGKLFIQGGHIDRTLVEEARTAQGADRGAFGFVAGADWKWSSYRQWKDTDLRLCGSVQGKWLGDIRWTPELFDLLFMGNGGHLGRWDVLDGSRIRTTGWVNASIGLEGKNQNRIEWGVVCNPRHFDAQIRNGQFYVDESIDSLIGYIRADVDVAQKMGWGTAINAEWHFLRAEAPFAFHVRLQNLGVVLSPELATVSVDTLVETSGLTFTGNDLSLEAIQSDAFGEGIVHSDTARWRPRGLPARLDASMEYPLGPRSGWDFQVQLGEWMPLPQAITGYRRAIGKNWQTGVQLIAGGWGRLRPAAWARWRKPGHHGWVFYIEDPFGWGSNSAYGRGLTVQFQNLK
ncbi:MAG: hypothetical protein O2818_01915 [Bacteroidetes bacterium]|nr:hypothetical protein [Bacteroidota bacterium]MDA1335620.1 hypothetical protein [Bacteroidota bacterium]